MHKILSIFIKNLNFYLQIINYNKLQTFYIFKVQIENDRD